MMLFCARRHLAVQRAYLPDMPLEKAGHHAIHVAWQLRRLDMREMRRRL